MRTDTHTVTSCAGVRLRPRHLALDLSLSTRVYTQLTHSTHADMHTDICCLTVISRTVSVESYSSLPPPRNTTTSDTHSHSHTRVVPEKTHRRLSWRCGLPRTSSRIICTTHKSIFFFFLSACVLLLRLCVFVQMQALRSPKSQME